MNQGKHKSIISHYEDCLAKHGDTHLGVDWPNEKDAETRYWIMLDMIPKKHKHLSLLDFGCGASHLYEYMLRNNYNEIDYCGLDASEAFCAISQKKYPHNQYYCLDILAEPESLGDFDFVVMNGVFTEKCNLNFEEMFEYFKQMLRVIFPKVNIGIAFNVMSKAVDWERDDLFHLPTDLLINFLTKELSRHFIIRNDYGLYEYTVYLFKEPLCLR
jgi:SAM-dependent methyltransferase